MVEEENEDSPYVVLNPCFEYYSDPIQVQTPQGKIEMIGRTKIVCPFDHTMGAAQVTIHVNAICFFKHMQHEDRLAYETMIEETCRNIEAQRVKRNTGIVITRDLPNGGIHAPGRT